MLDKKNKRELLIIPIILIGIFSFAQSIHLPMIKEVEDDFFTKSQSILPVYKYESNLIEPYSKFGLKSDPSQSFYSIVNLPEMKNCRDTGYTYIYFSGSDNDIRQGYILALIGNYKRSRRTVYFYIDRNNDLDFSNDGLPDSLVTSQNDFKINLKNLNAKNANYSFKLTRFKYGENVRYKNLLTQHYKAHSGQKKFTKINYCFREQRYNSSISHFNNGKDSFTLGIKDVNVNGIYNDGCVDKLYVGAYNSQINSDKLFIIKPEIEENTFEWGRKSYRIMNIHSNGDYLEIIEDDRITQTQKLKIGRKTPKFSYLNIFNIEHNLKEYRKQKVYLFFWDKQSLSREDTIYLSLLNKDFNDKLKLITLNHGDKPKQVRIKFYYDQIKWPVGYSNSEIAEKYFLENVSIGYYLDKKHRLINDQISPKEMYELMINELDS
ncbi:MAG: hypothetical protein P8I11_06605 [Bacteroidia bacterium]|nr:hypothetical protein [Bacteroidia bacterium]